MITNQTFVEGHIIVSEKEKKNKTLVEGQIRECS